MAFALPGNGRVLKGMAITLGVALVAGFGYQQHRVIRVHERMVNAMEHHEDSTRRAKELDTIIQTFQQPERESLRRDLLPFMSEGVQAIVQRAQEAEAARRIDEGRQAAERVRTMLIEQQREVKLPPGRYEIRRLDDPRPAPIPPTRPSDNHNKHQVP